MNQIAPTPETMDLITVPTADTALAVFTDPDGLDPLLALIRKQIDAFVPDMTTAAGRKEIKSFAYKIAQSKTALDAVGKELVAELKDLPRKVDANRKSMRDTLDKWRDEVRQPVDDYEAAEEARIKRHSDAIAAMSAATQLPHGISAMEIKARLDSVDAVSIEPATCDEFLDDYLRAKTVATDTLTAAHAAAVKQEADQAELDSLRAKVAEQERLANEESARKAAIAREEQVKADAAAQATKDAEARAQREREALELQAREANLRAAEAERRAADAQAAAAAETARIAQAAEDERRAREADTEHKGSINRAAAAAMVAQGLSEEVARQAVTMIARKLIPAISINY